MAATIANAIGDALLSAIVFLWVAIKDLFWPTLGFALLALMVGGAAAFKKARAATGEVRINLVFYAIDAIITSPLIALLLGAIGAQMQHAGVTLLRPSFWAILPMWLTGFAAIFIGDFIGYWRHRLEHTPPLWPAHAIHHSDQHMTWTTLLRFHPINRLSTSLIDTTVLALFGFPPWALVLSNLFRHYYGMFIHMDVPWTYGPLGRVLVSPVLHRWHHIRESVGAGANFATVFSVFDQAFGTYLMPGLCTAPLGVRDDIGAGAVAQVLYPFRIALHWLGRSLRRPQSKPA